MAFEITKEYIDTLEQMIDANHQQDVKTIIEGLHPADIAEIYAELDIETAKFIHLLLDQETATDVLVELDELDRKKLLRVLPGDIIAKQYINHMNSDDAADIIGELDEFTREQILENIDDIEKAGNILDLLEYDEYTAGGLMAKELVLVNENWKITTCLREMRRQATNIDDVYFIYVVDNKRILKGLVSLKNILFTDEETKIKEIYNENVISVKASADSEEVVNIMQKYDLVALPVVDGIGRLLGRITIDDVVDVIREEADEDYQMLSGIVSDVSPSSGLFSLTKARIPWLIVGMIGGIFGSKIIGAYESDIQIHPEMAIFIPMIAAMGGNVGVQSSSIIVKGLANNTLGIETVGMRLAREFAIACFNGIILAGLIFLYNLAFSDSFALTMSVSIAMFAVIIFASIFGTFIPLILDKANVDPALATGPFITTTNDIFGLLIYLGIGRVMHGLF